MPIELGMTGATCIVTGATRGIGRAVVQVLLDDGASVVAIAGSENSAATLRAELAIHDQPVLVIAQDMGASDSGTRVVDAALDRFGDIDLVTNIASVFRNQALHEINRADWIELFEVKLLGYWNLANAAADSLERRQGAIVNVAGVAGVVATPTSPHVGAVNAGIISMSEGLARAFAGRGIRVNTVSPGVTETDRFADRSRTFVEAGRGDLADARAELSQHIPVGYPADPKELALIIALLGSRVFRSVVGAHLVVDGGGTLGARRRA